MPKNKLKPTDGIGPKEIKYLRIAMRLVWTRSHSRRLVVKRCTRQNGYYYCEKCLKRTPLLKVDHIVPCGDVLDGGFIKRLFTPSKNLQGLCKPCHDKKTKEERKALKAKTKAVYTDDFY
jgi:5-methylcytosine-specific restriction endonuclease McrA